MAWVIARIWVSVNDRHDVAVTCCGQRGEAEIDHRGELVRAACWGRKVGEGSRVQVPDQAKGRGKDRREVQINHYSTLKSTRRNASGGVDRVRYNPSQRGESYDITAAAEHALCYR